jgi:hypothetical protein
MYSLMLIKLKSVVLWVHIYSCMNYVVICQEFYQEALGLIALGKYLRRVFRLDEQVVKQ